MRLRFYNRGSISSNNSIKTRKAVGEVEAEVGIKETVVAGLRETIATLKDEAARMKRALEEAEERTLEKVEECRGKSIAS